jgi:hypothetical protein
MRLFRMVALASAAALVGSVMVANPALAKQPEKGEDVKATGPTCVTTPESSTTDPQTRTVVDPRVTLARTNSAKAEKWVGNEITNTYEVYQQRNKITTTTAATTCSNPAGQEIPGQSTVSESHITYTEWEWTGEKLLSTTTCFINPAFPNGRRC